MLELKNSLNILGKIVFENGYYIKNLTTKFILNVHFYKNYIICIYI